MKRYFNVSFGYHTITNDTGFGHLPLITDGEFINVREFGQILKRGWRDIYNTHIKSFAIINIQEFNESDYKEFVRNDK